MIKKGDVVEVTQNDYSGSGQAPLGVPLTVCHVYDNDHHYSGWRGPLWELCDKAGKKVFAYEWNIKKTNKMSIKESFALAFKNEPEKSFRKTGITNGDDFLTGDGQQVFLSWLLKRHGEDFKKEVVDALLEDIEKKKE